MIDQHALHERILYDHGSWMPSPAALLPRRPLMAPQVLVPASSRAAALLEEHRQMIEDCGFTFDQFGPGAMAIRTIPEVVPASQAESVCRRLMQRLRENVAERRSETLPQMLACLAAMKAGTTLSLPEQQQLLRDWGKIPPTPRLRP